MAIFCSETTLGTTYTQVGVGLARAEISVTRDVTLYMVANAGAAPATTATGVRVPKKTLRSFVFGSSTDLYAKASDISAIGVFGNTV